MSDDVAKRSTSLPVYIPNASSSSFQLEWMNGWMDGAEHSKIHNWQYAAAFIPLLHICESRKVMARTVVGSLVLFIRRRRRRLLLAVSTTHSVLWCTHTHTHTVPCFTLYIIEISI